MQSKTPYIGYGTWSLDDVQAEQKVYNAIKLGYRHIDTAKMYNNERGVGRAVNRALKEGLVKRDDLTVVTKIVPSPYLDCEDALNHAAAKLNLDYIDIMYIHERKLGDLALYKAIENRVLKGQIKAIGISNYYTITDIEKIYNAASIKPCSIQNEHHIYFQNTAIRSYLKSLNMTLEAWYPFGGRGFSHDSFNHPTIVNLAKKYAKQPSQIIVKWDLQNDVSLIAGSNNDELIKENIETDDFSLTEDEVRELNYLDTNRRYEEW